MKSYVGRRVAAAVCDLGDIAEHDRVAVLRFDDHAADVAHGREVTAGLESRDGATNGTRAGRTDVRPVERGRDLQRVDMRAGEPRRIELDRDLARPSADDRHFGDVGDLGDRLAELRGDEAQLMVVVPAAPQRERQYGDVVDGSRFDEGSGCPRGKPIEIGRKLFVQANEGARLVLTDEKPDDDGGLPRTRGRVDILDPGDFP